MRLRCMCVQILAFNLLLNRTYYFWLMMTKGAHLWGTEQFIPQRTFTLITMHAANWFAVCFKTHLQPKEIPRWNQSISWSIKTRLVALNKREDGAKNLLTTDFNLITCPEVIVHKTYRFYGCFLKLFAHFVAFWN